MIQVRITRSAETDLLEEYAFYEQQQAGIGDYILSLPPVSQHRRKLARDLN